MVFCFTSSESLFLLSLVFLCYVATSFSFFLALVLFNVSQVSTSSNFLFFGNCLFPLWTSRWQQRRRNGTHASPSDLAIMRTFSFEIWQLSGIPCGSKECWFPWEVRKVGEGSSWRFQGKSKHPLRYRKKLEDFAPSMGDSLDGGWPIFVFFM